MSERAAETAVAEEFEAVRPRLFGVAYRMTGSVVDAEDVCQEAWLRWRAADRSDVTTPEAYLVRTVTNLAIDRLRSAQHRREQYVGPYLPEPLVTDDAGDPAAAAELSDSLTLAFLVMLDELTPVERAVLLLHDVFGYEFEEVAAAVDRSPDACRQLASRTRLKLEHERVEPRRPDVEHQRRMIEQLLVTTANGDIEGLMDLLAPDVVQLGDGGPDRHAARRPVVGRDRVARFFANNGKRMLGFGYEARLANVNGGIGLVFVLDGRPDAVMSFAFAADGRVSRIYNQINPEKLKHLASLSPPDGASRSPASGAAPD
jgi:RNA polymerase sigma-70 factor, ECF subfamily